VWVLHCQSWPCGEEKINFTRFLDLLFQDRSCVTYAPANVDYARGNNWITVTVSVAHLFVRHFCASKSCLATVTAFLRLAYLSTRHTEWYRLPPPVPLSVYLYLVEMRRLNVATPDLRRKQTLPIYLSRSTTFAEKRPSSQYLHIRAVTTTWQASIIFVQYTRRVTAD